MLNEEDGFDIKPRELMRVRTMNRWLMRVPNGDKSKDTTSFDEVESLEDGSPPLLEYHPSLPLQPNHEAAVQAMQHSPEDPSEMAGYEDALERSGKRRRKRSRFMTDSSGASVRFPSEMTIDEARIILQLDQTAYRCLRSTFQQICNEECVSKKTVAGPERWEASKTRLVREMPELQNTLWVSTENAESKKLALDAICTDVTKRMRTLETRMTLAEARNVLGVNPQESREIRTTFQQVLRDARFVGKISPSPQQWEELKLRWGERSDIIKKILTDEDGEPVADQQQTRALEVLARDVMKRLRDDRVRKPSTKDPQQFHSSPPTGSLHEDHEGGSIKLSQTHGSSPLTDHLGLGDGMTPSNFDDMSEASHASQLAFSPTSDGLNPHLPLSLQSQTSSLSDTRDGLPQPSRVLGSSMPAGMSLESQMDSSLLLANTQPSFLDQPYVPEQFGSAAPTPQVFHQCPTVPTACAVYLRLHPSSSFVSQNALWIATIMSPSLQELRHAAEDKFPGSLCMRVEGILKDGKGGELPLQIEQDQELYAYLAHLQGAAPTFNVQLVWKSS